MEMKKQYRYWGKAASSTLNDGRMHLLAYHCLDVSAVGKEYLHVNLVTQHILAEKVGLEKVAFAKICCFFLALHDIGKFAASFQNLKPDLRSLLNLPSKKKYNTRHDALGWWLWDNCIRTVVVDKLSKFEGKEKRRISKWLDVWMRIASGHHGKPVDNNGRCRDDFAKIDIEAACLWVEVCYDFFDIGPILSLSQLLDRDILKRLKLCSWELAGIFTLCDWIGSNADHFPFHDQEESISNYWETSCAQGLDAIEKAGVVKAAVVPDISLEILFPDFYTTPTPLQALCADVGIPQMPQCWILEDVTGAGKTEASLLLAGKIASAGLADGIFIGLPTMATSNAMYGRMSKCYRKLFDDGKIPSLILAHGSRHLSKEFQSSILNDWFEGGKKNISPDAMEAQCTRWLSDSSKKAFLADVGVGSLDQVLLGSMPVRHQSLRWCGLARKVLIVDEIHAYDHYMLQILENALKGLAAAGASVVMLSATLPFTKRERLLKAFYSGRGGNPEDIECECTGYPLVSAVGCVEPLGEVFAFEDEVETRESVRRELDVKLIDSQEEVFEQIRIALKKGQCFCWIRNTVGDALDAFSILQDSGAVSDDRLHLFHSRFAMGDRLNIENDILRHFGKNSVGKERSGRILIATQVVEQSLDLDFDILISDLAPIDYLIQRAGRQHRHMRDEFGNPVHKLPETVNREKPTFYIYGPTPTTEPEADWFSRVFPGASYVYEDTAILWKTQQLLYTYGKIKMPEMARALIEGVYGDDGWNIPDVFYKAKNKVEGKDSGKRSMGSFNSINFKEGYSLASSARWAEEEHVPTRLGADNQIVYLTTYLDGRLVPFHQGEFAWDKSSLSIRMGSLQNLILPDDEERAIENLRKTSRKFYENDLIIVLKQKDGSWECEGESANGTSVFVHYDQVTGWQLRKIKSDD